MCLFSATPAGNAGLVLSEVFINPPGTDAPSQYLELRGAPNSTIPAGTALVAINGAEADDPGTVGNVFDLSGRVLGGNGFLVLLQKGNAYATAPGASVLANTDSGSGFGSGSSSSLGHRGLKGATDLPHASVTFMLVQSAELPKPGDDIDADDDGVPDGSVYAGWTVLDSVGVLGSHGAGDIAYGAVNFRRNTQPGDGALANGGIVSIGFTPSYVARAGNSTGSTAADWVAADNLAGSAPNWTLGDKVNTIPSGLAGVPLQPLGGPNFGAPPLPGVTVTPVATGIDVTEGGPPATYALGLNTVPGGPIVLTLQADSEIELSIDHGQSFAVTQNLTLADTVPANILVRAQADDFIGASPRPHRISHSLSATADPAGYPLGTPIPNLEVRVLEKGTLQLNELKVNPPGATNGPWEYVEFQGTPQAGLTNLYFLGVESAKSKNPGVVNLAIPLTGAKVGSGGLLVIGAPGDAYRLPGDATLWPDPAFSQPDGALSRGPSTYLLIGSPTPIEVGTDLDAGDNGVIEGLPDGASIVDSLTLSSEDEKTVAYGSTSLTLAAEVPDAAIRFPVGLFPQATNGWVCGRLAGTNGASLIFDSSALSPGFPVGAVLSPGRPNEVAVTFQGLVPWSGVVGDPTNPGLNFGLTDLSPSPSGEWTLRATSSDPAIVPDAHLNLAAGPGGQRTVYLDPVGVGFCTIIITATNGSRSGGAGFPYAASAMGRPGGIFELGASDASAALALDADHMLVGDDENQILRLYPRGHSAPPLAQWNFWDELDVSSQNAGEVDIEGATRVGNRLYWIGSHSHSFLAESRTNRMRFFATDLVGSGVDAQLQFVGYYEHFKTDLVQWDNANGHGKGPGYYGLAASVAEGVNPKSPEGFNIEGLSMAPGSTDAAYIGLRAPVVPLPNRTHALIIQVLNFATLAASGGPPGSIVFGPPIELDLYGRGLRSLEGTATGYLISAGNPGDGPNLYPLDFKLYTWTGLPTDQPRQLAADLTGLQPETIVELPPLPWTAQTRVQLMSDLGARNIYNDGVPNKRQPYPFFRKSRSDWVLLGPEVKPAPIIVSSSIEPGRVTLTWRALTGETYRVQACADLAHAVWGDLTGDVRAPGPYVTQTLATDPARQQYYRVILP